ncbi:MAG TPA: hypothetical protein VME17_17945 [Bryobacteraceae bacterium]|nr:hypothetical protein [Bryobacteraceae bacterium]
MIWRAVPGPAVWDNVPKVLSRSIFGLIIMAGACVIANSQWLTYPTPGIPRMRDGKPNLTAPARLAAGGKPDLSGVWQAEPTPVAEMTRLFGDLSPFSALGDSPSAFSKYLVNILVDVKPGEASLRPEFAGLLRERSKEDTPLLHCLPIGVPADDLIPGPFKIIQTPGLMLIRNEYENTLRQIYTDGRKAPADPDPLWLGYSVGKWEGDTMVVATVGFNDKGWLDGMGHPHSEALHVVERFHRRDFGHMDMQVTVDDPKMYTHPFSIKFTALLLPDTDVTEYFCNENERDGTHSKGN